MDAEIQMLNADELDVEELERRLEMAVSAPETMLGYICGVDGCVDCPNLTTITIEPPAET